MNEPGVASDCSGGGDPTKGGSPAASRLLESTRSVKGASRVTPCTHRWAIEPANGPTSPGTCQGCGETREFRNSLREPDWREEKNRMGRMGAATMKLLREGRAREDALLTILVKGYD